MSVTQPHLSKQPMQSSGAGDNKQSDCKYNFLGCQKQWRTPHLADVYFDRNLKGFSAGVMPRAKSAQLKLEHYYKVAVDAAVERSTR